MIESDKPTINEMQKIDVATPILSKHQKYPYNAIFIATIFFFIIALVVLQQIQKTPEIASTAIAPTIDTTKAITKSPTIIPTSISFTNTSPIPQYTPLPTRNIIAFKPDQTFIDSLPVIDGPEQYPSSWPKDKSLIPLQDQFRYVANMVNKDVGFSVVLSLYDKEAIFNCNEPVANIVTCAQKPPSSFVFVYRITLAQDNPFSFDDPLRWLRLDDQQRSHIKVTMIREADGQYEYVFETDGYGKDIPAIPYTTRPWIQPFTTSENELKSDIPSELKSDIPWRYFNILRFGCFVSCPGPGYVFVRKDNPANIYVLGMGQNGPDTEDITGRPFGYIDTFRILPKN